MDPRGLGWGLTLLEQWGDLPSYSMRMQIKPGGAKSRIYWCREWKCPANSFRHRASSHNFMALSFHFLATFQPHNGQDGCCPSGNRILISGRKVPRRDLIGQASDKSPMTVPGIIVYQLASQGWVIKYCGWRQGRREGWQAQILQWYWLPTERKVLSLEDGGAGQTKLLPVTH